MTGIDMASITPRIRSSSERQWRYFMCVGVTGVILRTASLSVSRAYGKLLMIERYRYVRELSWDYLETKLFRQFLRRIGAM